MAPKRKRDATDDGVGLLPRTIRWKTPRLEDYADYFQKFDISEDEYIRQRKRAEEFYKHEYRYNPRWMTNYLTFNYIEKRDQTGSCHECLDFDRDGDELFKCANSRCQRFTHHAYECSQGGVKDVDIPANARIERLWFCWECTWEAAYDTSYARYLKLKDVLSKAKKATGKTGQKQAKPSGCDARGRSDTSGTAPLGRTKQAGVATSKRQHALGDSFAQVRGVINDMLAQGK